jgi:hypothetical protein
MEIICASICYRGYAEDELAATLSHAPRRAKWPRLRVRTAHGGWLPS